jgi:hypothetical protein
MPSVTVVDAVKPDIAMDLLRDCLGSGGRVVPGKHFREELSCEHLNMLDAWHVLRTGYIFDPPEHDVRTGEWKYQIKGCVPDGKQVCIVFSFKQVNTAYLITVFSIEAR